MLCLTLVLGQELRLPHDLPYPVLFERVTDTLISKATFTVISTLDFKPLLTNFRRFEAYVLAFKTNLEDMMGYAIAKSTLPPTTLVSKETTTPSENINGTTLSNDQQRFKNLLRQLRTTPAPIPSGNESAKPTPTIHSGSKVDGCTNFDCTLGQNIQEIQHELDSIVATYIKIKTKFTSTVQHLQQHPNKLEGNMKHRGKRSVPNEDYVYLSMDEFQVYQLIANALEKMIPRDVHSRSKRFGIDTIILGAGIYANRHDIEKL